MNPWIVVVNYNGWDDTRPCLHSLAAQTAPCAVVLVDNASAEDRTAEFRSEFPWCHVVRNSINGGWAGGNNAGIRYALGRDADRVVLLNNDTTVSPRLIEALLAAAAANPGYGILGPVICFMDEPDAVMADGTAFNRPGYNGFFRRVEVPLRPGEPAAVVDVDVVNGCCMMVSRAVFERVGLVDERYFLVHEESDLCLRARRAGFRCGVLGEALVWHKGSSSFKRSGRRLQRYYDARNLLLLLTKHASRHRPGRGLPAALWAYLKYVYYRYCVERENDSPDAADAVLEGACDALARRFGPRTERRRRLLPGLRALFDLKRGRPNRPRPTPEAGDRAVAVR